MRYTVLASAVLLLLLPRAAAGADPDVMSDLHVTIRTYDTSSLPPDARQAAIATATGILALAGVTAVWMECDAVFVRSTGDPCLAPLGRTELSVRIVRLPPKPGHAGILPLGYSLVDTKARSGALATIYADRIAGLAVNCNIDFGLLLGRAVAHEIGHLLLGTPEHADKGLMRALWSRESITDSPESTWVFTTRDARSMRVALQTRAAEQFAHAIREFLILNP
ncbi:MAG: hypothetical protein FJW14_11690 [Acidimicrobiia bacterium]|nr:hypothetical protein [Acidimicrobiia bacterium]